MAGEIQDYKEAALHWLRLVFELSRLNQRVQSRDSGISEQPNEIKLRALYESRGWIAFILPAEVAAQVAGYFDPHRAIPFSPADFSRGYLNANVTADAAQQLNRDMIYYDSPDPLAAAALVAIVEALRKNIETMIGPFSIANVRAWNTKKTTGNIHGPISRHTDGLSEHVRKIMLYPIPPNIENGTIEITGRDGKTVTLESENLPAAILADVGVLKHRGLPPQKLDARPAIEITLIPSFLSSINANYYGQNARIPFPSVYDFSEVAAFLAYLADRLRIQTASTFDNPSSALNVIIGGGSAFNASEWVNFDAAAPHGASRLSFGPNTKIPYPDNHAQHVYASDHLTHLQDESVLQLLSEARRILRDDGRLVIKLPNFEGTLREWKNGGATESSGAAAAAAFCRFSNTPSADHFSYRYTATGEAFYFGPPRVPGWKITRILNSSSSPHFVAALLRSEVLRTEYAPKFDRQNAWSYMEFVEVAAACGLELIECADVCDSYRHIPTIEVMREISQYYVFKKALT